MIVQNYFHSPIITLLESASGKDSDLTLHDLTEAYATLSNRIMRQSHRLRVSNSALSALTPFKTHRVNIFQVLRRDIQRCLLDTTSSKHDHLFGSYGFCSSMIHFDATRQEADASLLSYSALYFLSQIFMYDVLHNIFTSEDAFFVRYVLRLKKLQPIISRSCCRMSWQSPWPQVYQI
jgi:hypothetical protein